MLFTKTLENTADSINDKYSIKELIEFERFCRDNGLWNEMRKCYRENSRVSISWFHGTGAEFVNASMQMNARAPHKLYNTVIELKNNKAAAVTMATIQTRVEMDRTTWDLQSDLKLLYGVEKVKGEWLIVSVDGIYEQDILLPCYFNTSYSLPVDIMKQYRPSYANLSYVLSKGGHSVQMDLPGIDRPDTIEQLYSKMDQWLNTDQGAG